MSDPMPMSPAVAADLVDLEDSFTASAELVARGQKAYENDPMLHLAAEAISNRFGEAVQRLDLDWKGSRPAVPWKAIRDNRNFIVHRYDNINYGRLWNTLAVDVPKTWDLLRDDIAHAHRVLDSIPSP